MPSKAISKQINITEETTIPSDRHKLAQAINTIAIHGEKFAEALSDVKTLTKETLMAYDMQMQSKKSEMEDLTSAAETAHKAKCLQLENDFNNNKLDTTQKLREFQLDACGEFANKYEHVVIKEEEYTKMSDTIDSLTTQLTSLQEKKEEELDSAI